MPRKCMCHSLGNVLNLFSNETVELNLKLFSKYLMRWIILNFIETWVLWDTQREYLQ